MTVRKCSEDILREESRIKLRDPHCDEGMRDRRTLRHWRNLLRRRQPAADDFTVSLREAFALAEKQVPSIVARRGMMGGNPCIKGTRVPVYMILDGIEYYGSLKGALKSYPQLSIQQAKDAVRFAKIAMECYVEP